MFFVFVEVMYLQSNARVTMGAQNFNRELSFLYIYTEYSICWRYYVSTRNHCVMCCNS